MFSSSSFFLGGSLGFDFPAEMELVARTAPGAWRLLSAPPAAPGSPAAALARGGGLGMCPAPSAQVLKSVRGVGLVYTLGSWLFPKAKVTGCGRNKIHRCCVVWGLHLPFCLTSSMLPSADFRCFQSSQFGGCICLASISWPGPPSDVSLKQTGG